MLGSLHRRKSQEKCSLVTQTKSQVPHSSENIFLRNVQIFNKLPITLTFNIKNHETSMLNPLFQCKTTNFDSKDQKCQIKNLKFNMVRK